jgi:hypothetical protein
MQAQRISLVIKANAECSRCGTRMNGAEWVAIDLLERPDLRSFLESTDWLATPCPSCKELVERTTPLVVTRLSAVAPMLVALPSEEFGSGEDSTVCAAATIDGVRQRMGTAVNELGGLVTALPFSTLRFAAGRDLAADVEDITAAVKVVKAIAPEIASDYEHFLGVVRRSIPERRFQYALDHVLMMESFEAFQHLFLNYPELESASARESVVLRAQTASGAEQLFAQATLAVLDKWTTGDSAGAWVVSQQGLKDFSTNVLDAKLDHLFASLEDLKRRREWSGALAAADELIPLGHASGNEFIEAYGSLSAAGALLAMTGPGYADRLERAVSYATNALQIVNRHPNAWARALRAVALANLAVVIAARLYGDPAANQEHAIALLRQAVGLL